MKVLMLTSSYPLFEGDGTAPFIEDIARSVAALGHQVDVVLPAHRRWNRNDEPGLRFFPFSYAPHPALSVWGFAQSLDADRGFKWKTLAVAPFAALATMRALKRRLLAEPYDQIHAHWVVPGGVLARTAATGRAFVISLHGSDVFAAEKNAVVGHQARLSFEAAGAVSACSSDLRDRAIRLGAPAARIRTVPYGVDVDFFSRPLTDSTARDNMRRRLGASPGRSLVLAVGRLVEKKGFETLIDACAGRPDLHIALVGDGDLRDALLSRASRTGASVTLAGRFTREEVRDALAVADVAAIPSVVDSNGNVDGLPNSLLEAMAAGRPIVASRVAGIPDVIEDGAHGLLVPPRDPKALAMALSRLTANPGASASLGTAAAARAAGELSWLRVARTLEEMYVQAQALAKR